MKIVIVGGKNKAKNLIKNFSKLGYKIVYINMDNEWCHYISREFNIKRVVCGDASDPSVLIDAKINGWDLMIALTPNDATNLVVCRLATVLGVGRRISIVNTPANISVFHKLGVKTTVSMAEMISMIIEQNAFTNKMESLLPIENGKVLLIQIEIEQGFSIVGKKIFEAGIPQGGTISCILRGEDAIVPNGNTEIMAGDRIIVLSLPEVKQKIIDKVTL